MRVWNRNFAAKPTMHLLAPLAPTPLRTIKVRPRQPACPACSSPEAADRWRAFMESGTGEWDGWEDPLCARPGVGERAADGGDEGRVSAMELLEAYEERGVRVVDTRSETEFAMTSVEGSRSEPAPACSTDLSAWLAFADASLDRPRRLAPRQTAPGPLRCPRSLRPPVLLTRSRRQRAGHEPVADLFCLPQGERLPRRCSRAQTPPRPARGRRRQADRGGGCQGRAGGVRARGGPGDAGLLGRTGTGLARGAEGAVVG